MSSGKNKKTIKSSDFINSLEKGLNVIRTFSENTPALTVSDVAKITGYSRPAVRRILLTLEHLGYAESNNGVYRLTPHILTLGYAYLSSQDKWNLAQPYMREFVAQTGESISIAVLDDTSIIYVARVPTKKIMTISLNIGSRLPAHATSMGHVLLAHLPEDKLEDYLNKSQLEKYTEYTITDKNQLKEELRKVRERGWALVVQQLEEGLLSIAAPIYDANEEVIAAVNCSAHAGRISIETLTENYLPKLLKTAELISNSIKRYT